MAAADLLDKAIAELQRVLGPAFTVSPLATSTEGQHADSGTGLDDRIVEIKDARNGTYAQLFVEARAAVSPVVVRRDLGPKYSLMRRLPGKVAALVVSEWLSPETRAAVSAAGAWYLDLHGNVELELENPRISIHREGAGRNPDPVEERRGTAGPLAGRLVRLLVDVVPPYRGSGLAEVAGLSRPYVSRLLATLTDEGLLDRRGPAVVDVDWETLLRRRGAGPGLLKTHSAVGMLAPRGQQQVYAALADPKRVSIRREVAVTGAVAAAEVAPLLIGAPLMLYVPSDVRATDRVGDGLGLVRTGSSADVLLLRDNGSGVYDRSHLVRGVPHVALSQVVIDCLSGPDRLPVQGEAVLVWMRENESRWRLPGFDALRRQEGAGDGPAAVRRPS